MNYDVVYQDDNTTIFIPSYEFDFTELETITEEQFDVLLEYTEIINVQLNNMVYINIIIMVGLAILIGINLSSIFAKYMKH